MSYQVASSYGSTSSSFIFYAPECERNQLLTVRPQLVEGLKQSFLSLDQGVRGWGGSLTFGRKQDNKVSPVYSFQPLFR